MAYKALYRTYRPTTFEEVVGQEHIVRTLKNALATGKIAHAYLFAGPRGTGKTTMAKLFAKALNCENGMGCQCNACKNCTAINEGSHPDVLELDAASNNGVDEIRNIIDKVKYGTILGRYKVYIIDEVHMLSTGAFNALLKTLEEPPEHVIFILATTEPHKILPTILSRVQRYDFTKISDQDIKKRIRIVLESENIAYNEEAVNLIVSLSDGGMRDALSILDQVLAYSGDTLNAKDVLDIFSLESLEEKMHLIASIATHQVSDVLARVNHYFEKGSDIRRLTDDLLLILKDALVYKNTRDMNYLELIKEGEAETLCQELTSDQILQMIEILMNALKDFKTVTSIRPIFEVAMLKMTGLSDNPTPVISTQKIEEPKPAAKEVIPETPSIQEEVTPVYAADPLSHIITLKNTLKEGSYSIDDDLMLNIMVSSKKDMKNNLLSLWGKLKSYSMHPALAKAANLLIDDHPLVVSSKILIVECPNKINVEKMNLEENQKELQTLTKEAFGNQMFVYAVSRNDSIRYQQKYLNLLQLSKLPKAKDIILEFSEEENL